MQSKIKYALSGAAAGIINGALGAGGGVVLVPLLLGFVRTDDKRAFATSVFIMLPISAVSAAVYFICGRLDFMQALPYLIGGLAGGIIAGKYFRDMPVLWLRRLFGAVLIIGGIRAVLFK